MKTRRRHVALHEAEVGMVLCSPISVVTNGVLRCSLPAGLVLTKDNLHQLTIHHAEFLFVSEADSRTVAEIAEDTALALQRVTEIFSAADLSNPTMAALYEQVLAYRSTV
jgi:hypothetical protein